MALTGTLNSAATERITRSARIRSFWTSPVEETKTRIVFMRRLPVVDSFPYHRHHLQEFGWALEASRRVFLKEHLKENDERLRNTSELFDAVTGRADADTSPQRESPGMAPGPSASPKASRQASTDPNGCLRPLPRIARDWRTPVSLQKLPGIEIAVSESDSATAFASPRSMIFAVAVHRPRPS